LSQIVSGEANERVERINRKVLQIEIGKQRAALEFADPDRMLYLWHLTPVKQ
jgi:hypothetical protein